MVISWAEVMQTDYTSSFGCHLFGRYWKKSRSLTQREELEVKFKRLQISKCVGVIYFLMEIITILTNLSPSSKSEFLFWNPDDGMLKLMAIKYNPSIYVWKIIP